MILTIPASPCFDLGEVFATIDAIATFAVETLLECLHRHANLDWGDLDEPDRAVNDRALESGGRLFSRFHFPEKGKLYVVTEADRCTTTLMLSTEY